MAKTQHTSLKWISSIFDKSIGSINSSYNVYLSSRQVSTKTLFLLFNTRIESAFALRFVEFATRNFIRVDTSSRRAHTRDLETGESKRKQQRGKKGNRKKKKRSVPFIVRTVMHKRPNRTQSTRYKKLSTLEMLRT